MVGRARRRAADVGVARIDALQAKFTEPWCRVILRENRRRASEAARIHEAVELANHGAVGWGFDVQDAYFKMEILESYCRTVLVATQLGNGPNRFDPGQVKELLAIKRRLGIPDPRLDGAPPPAPKP